MEATDLADVKKALITEWKVIKPGTRHSSEDRSPEDIAIYTVDNYEVLCTSEWLRVNEETMHHIVKLHNEFLRR